MTIAPSLSGSSEIARYIAEQVSQSIRHLRTSHALGTPCVLDELNEVWNEVPVHGILPKMSSH